ncbi:Imm49 family immunity protein [Litorilituus sediminis]|uniref:Uncharacterized protein n=1 Tax=Litorilituus sediminis TaxID=718192 RepID=A0A4P6P1P9_9GAMM|nr:Imm49 family immunity protein [Litorilituus sediminis]QBG34924.1 hypothetical protein EMK97_03825 [Litorilituus sediminis]
MLKLNKYKLDDLNELYDDLNYMVEHREPQIANKTAELEDRKNATFWLTSQYIEIAYTHFALENFDQVKPNLQKAAPYAFLRGFDPELKTHKSDWSIQKELNICLLFGEPELLQRIKTLDWSLTEDDIVHPAIYQYDYLLMQIATGEQPTGLAITKALDNAKTAKHKDVLQFFLPLIETISALVSGEKALWQSSIDKAVKWHSNECKFGDYKDIIDGFICLNALTMAKLGKELHGWQCETDSLYLPLFLID